ncbi:neuroligin-1 [Caerostris extrusa]|uniref:Neuroligin-1 n=1 Tax=Caerostris extrusa TaxID=172846 RepID=A0AAV4NEG8_CAEEX|nr:neuroligin-1 [Caerostris extrusa]
MGIEEDRRDRLLRTLVRNLYNYHLQEIFLTVVNEYTDWSKPDQHPINILDATADAMGDALVVAPLIRTGNYHSKLHKSSQKGTFMYVFMYKLKKAIMLNAWAVSMVKMFRIFLGHHSSIRFHIFHRNFFQI